MIRDLATGEPARKPACPHRSAAFSTWFRRPGALELPRSSEDRVFEVGLDLSCNRGLGPLTVRRKLLPVDRDSERVGMQRPRQDENIDPVAQIRIAPRRVPVGYDRAG